MEKKSIQQFTLDMIREKLIDGSIIAQNPIMNNDFWLVKGTYLTKGHFLLSEQPYRLEQTRLGVVREGIGEVVINLMNYELKPGMVVCLRDGDILQYKNVPENFSLMGLTVSNEFQHLVFGGNAPHFLNNPYFQRCLQPEAEDLEIVYSLFNSLYLTGKRPDYSRKTSAYIIAAIFRFYSHLLPQEGDTLNEADRHQVLLHKFVNLVNEYSAQQHETAFYAEKLFLSPRYMSALIKKISDKTAKEWIDLSIVQRAKVMLLHQDLQVSEIAYELHFPNHSFFCKFFRRLTGLSPQEYRSQQRRSSKGKE